MRPIPESSTDLLYSAFPADELIAVGHALCVSNIYYITTATLKPERALFHSCVNNVQARLKCKNWDETIQGIEIADRADRIYEQVLPRFQAKLAAHQPEMQSRKAQLSAFVQGFAAEESGPWDSAAFDARWPTADKDRFPYRWQTKAIETYRQMRENIASGAYTVQAPWDTLMVTHYWGERNLEYKMHRDISRRLVNAEIDALPEEEKLKYSLPDHREVVFVTGGMGSGKSRFTREFVSTLPPKARENIIPHDADYLKIAFARSAQREGMIEAYHGPEVQNESSNALYENARKRFYYARGGQPAPNVIINSTIAGSFELADGLEGGGSVHIHHISMSPKDALAACRKRAESVGRMPDEASVHWSSKASTNNLLELFDPLYVGKPIKVDLYERTDAAPYAIGQMDIAQRTVTITDMPAFLRMAERGRKEELPLASRRAFVRALLEKGVSLISTPEADLPPRWTLSPEGNITLRGGEHSASLNDIPEEIRTLVATIGFGGRVRYAASNQSRAM